MRKVNGLKVYSRNEVLDELVGKEGSTKRENYEFDLQMELIGAMIKQSRIQRGLTQEDLGKLLGVQKAQISKLEKSAKNVTIDTILKVFDALHATVKLKIELAKA